MATTGDGKKFKEIFNNSLDGIVIVSKAGVIIEANNAARNILSKKKLSGVRLDNLVSIENLVQSDLKKRRGIVRINSRFLGFSRSYGDNETTIYFFRDITDAKIEEQRSEHFLSIVSHEFKNPLAVIKALAYLTQKSLKKGDQKTKVFVTRISEKVDTLTRLLNELLDVTRIRRGKLPFKITRQNFDKIIRGVVSDFRLLNPKFEIKISGKGPREVFIDNERITQVLMNLLKNAVMYSGTSKKIEVRMKTLDKFVEVGVKDFGIGIKPGDKKKVFDLYYRQQINSKTTKGLGVGLYISKEIVKAHHGKFRVKSKEGVGSEFTFTLPLKSYSERKEESIT